MKQRYAILFLVMMIAGCNSNTAPLESSPRSVENRAGDSDEGSSLSAQVSKQSGQVGSSSADVSNEAPDTSTAGSAEEESLSAQVGASSADNGDRSWQNLDGNGSSLSSEGSSLTASVSDLNGLISDLGGRTTDTEIIVDLPSDVLFDFDKAEIRPDAVPTLEKLVRLLNASDSQTVQINGHTDAEGSDEYNVKLSQRRAEAVAAWLVAAGIENSHLQTTGYGETKPIAENKLPDGTDNPQGRAKNRRVEVVISK